MKTYGILTFSLLFLVACTPVTSTPAIPTPIIEIGIVEPTPIIPECTYHLPFAASEGEVEISQGNNGSKSHYDLLQYAVDFRLAKGTPVLASKDGKVSRVQSGQTDCGGEEKVSSMNYVILEHEGGEFSVYMHLSEVSVMEGDVSQGQMIGRVGNTGWTNCGPDKSKGYHLHYQVQKKGTNVSQSIPLCFAESDTINSGQTVQSSTVHVVDSAVMENIPTEEYSCQDLRLWEWQQPGEYQTIFSQGNTNTNETTTTTSEENREYYGPESDCGFEYSGMGIYIPDLPYEGVSFDWSGTCISPEDTEYERNIHAVVVGWEKITTKLSTFNALRVDTSNVGRIDTFRVEMKGSEWFVCGLGQVYGSWNTYFEDHPQYTGDQYRELLSYTPFSSSKSP